MRHPSPRSWQSRAVVGLSAVFLSWLTGCGSSDDTTDPNPPPLFTTEATLLPFTTCEDLDAWLTDIATEMAVDSMGGGWGLDYAAGSGRDGGVAVPDAGNADGGGSGGESGGPTDFTETNTQEEGVDEPDMMKTDGRHLYTITGRTLRIMKSWPADELQLLSTMELPGWGTQMLRVGDRLIVMAGVYDGGGSWGGGAGRPMPDRGAPGEWGDEGGWEVDPSALDFNGTRVLVIDVSNPSDPTVAATWDVQSSYVNARTVDGIVYMVAQSSAWSSLSALWSELEDYTVPSRQGLSTEAEWNAWREQVRTDLRPRVAQWVQSTGRALLLPDLRADEGAWEEMFACSDLYRPPMRAGSSILSVIAFNPVTLAAPAGTGVIADGWQVYGSRDSLYLSQDSRWWWFPSEGERTAKTHIHRFALDQGAPRYAASGSVEGWLLNQFSMSEYDGHLRVATTDWTSWGGGIGIGIGGDVAVDIVDSDGGSATSGGGGRPADGTDGAGSDGASAPPASAPPSMEKRILQVGEEGVQANNLFVLRETGRALEVVGGIRGLAPEERIYSARFLGPKAYVVTFRETDPLFTFDLSNPEEPQVLGELHIPGFSTYLHPFGDDHLIGVGRDGDDDGRIFGVQIQLFDVSDPTDPRRTHRVVIDQGDGWSSSEAEYDHRAFTFFPRSNLLALPITLQDYSRPEGEYRNFSGMIVYRVSTDNGFEEVGRVSHSGMAHAAWCTRSGRDSAECSWDAGWWTSMRRSVFADDWFYAISDVGVTVSPADAPASVAGTVTF